MYLWMNLFSRPSNISFMRGERCSPHALKHILVQTSPGASQTPSPPCLKATLLYFLNGWAKTMRLYLLMSGSGQNYSVAEELKNQLYCSCSNKIQSNVRSIA